MGRQRADDDVIPIFNDGVESGDAADVKKMTRLGEAHFHERQQALTAGENFYVVFVSTEKIHGLIDRPRGVIFKGPWDHNEYDLREDSGLLLTRRQTSSAVSGR